MIKRFCSGGALCWIQSKQFGQKIESLGVKFAKDLCQPAFVSLQATKHFETIQF